jgi:hypothetical protein
MIHHFFDKLTYPIRALFASPWAIFSTPRRVLGLSLPVRVALLVALVLILGTTTVLVIYRYAPDQQAGWEWWGLWHWVVIGVLLLVIPIVVHRTVKLWLEGDTSVFPDIDSAWRQGIAGLREQGLDARTIPIYLVLGVPNARQAKALFSASRIEFNMHDVPEGAAALHWYAGPEAIFICCTNACCLSLLSSRATRADGLAAAPPPPGGQPRNDICGTIVAGSPGPSMADTGYGVPAASMPPSGGTPDYQQTMDVGQLLDNAGPAAAQPQAVGGRGRLRGLLSKEAEEQSERLEYVCHLLRRLRNPVCAINGVLTVLPFHVIQQSDAHGSEVQMAARVDVAAICETVQLRCPVVAMIGDMETEVGFRELVRRIGATAAAQGAFGKGYNVWSYPHPEEIEAVTRHACGAFEDWVYGLFREQDGLKKKGNADLYNLLCLSRHVLRDRLINVLVGAFGHDPQNDPPEPEPLMFGGCYFAATGESEDRQAFVHNVIVRKLIGNEDELTWTQEAIDEDDRYHRMTNFMTIINGLLVLSIIGLVVYWFVER